MHYNNQNKTTPQQSSVEFKGAERIFDACVVSLWAYLKVCFSGIKRIKIFSAPTLIMLWSYFGFSAYMAKNLTLVHVYYYFFNGFWGTWITKLLILIPKWLHFIGLFLGFCTFNLFCYGIAQFLKNAKHQKALDELNLSSGKGSKPRVLESISMDENKTKLIIASKGIGIDKWESKKADLSSVFGEIVNSIEVSSNRSNVEIVLSKKELPKLCHFSKMKELLEKPYSFVVGESLKGPIVQQITDLPHLLVAGTSGNGKSVFMNNVILGLLHSSSRIKLFLLDLKMGVEVQQYDKFPNIQIAKSDIEAVTILEYLNKEMYSRYEYMRNEGVKKIDPERDKMDILVCAVDEAAELYGIDKGDDERKEIALKARRLTHSIARLARACGIHLVLATQKVTKDTIDTSVQGNTQGKMCFKVATIPSSSTVLGNKKAFELPAIKGRAIWSMGSDDIEVQAPFISEQEINEECAHLKEKFSKETNEDLLREPSESGQKPAEQINIENINQTNAAEDQAA